MVVMQYCVKILFASKKLQDLLQITLGEMQTVTVFPRNGKTCKTYIAMSFKKSSLHLHSISLTVETCS